MAVAPAAPRPSAAPSQADAQHKVKTAAKKRYLKAKKDRRKKRVAAAAQKPQSQQQKRVSPKPTSAAASDGDVSGDSSSDESSSSDEDAPAPVEREEPPRKRRKVAKEPEPEPQPEPEPKSVQDDEDDDNDDVMQNVAPAPPAALPSFPLPTQPAPPSAETLNRQGLDSALLGATRVDPHTTLDLDALPAGTLSERTKKRLKDLGIRELFAIQTALVPHLLAKPTRALYLPFAPPRDVCASAPTGSGKTLAYVLPLAELLATRAVPRLRALIVLPTRDLVTQVREVFEAVAKGAGLRVGSVTGASSFAHEKAQLVDKRGESKVDVLVCTPGRLIDHLDGTEGFTLQHLRFLVIDEADRLLTQSFQDWLARVLSAIAPPTALPSTLPSRPVAPSFLPHPFTSTGNTLQPDFEPLPRPSCQKLLLSATLTRDPGRLAALGLHHPQYFVVSSSSGGAVAPEEFGAVPEGLEERFSVVDPAEKPLVLAWILREHVLQRAEDSEKRQALVFCKSVEAATRLGALLAAMLADAGKSVASYSSDAPRSLLERFRTGAVDVLVCSDLVSRGLDVPSVAAVLNYDAPVDARKYVHRVGRTARAGRRGDAWTLVEGQEARHFKELLAAAGRTERVKKVRVAEKVLEPLRPAYEDALKKLAETYGRG